MFKRKGIINTEGFQKRQIGRYDKDEDFFEKERKYMFYLIEEWKMKMYKDREEF